MASSGAFEVAGQRGWWLEDAVPGAVLRHPGGRTVGPAEHVWLAWVTHNVSPVHGNADAASRSEWGEPLVLGMLTAAVVIGLAQPATPPPELGTLGWSDGWSSIRLTGIVVAGDTLSAESEIVAVTAAPGASSGRVQRTVRGRNQRGELVALIEDEREVPRRHQSDRLRQGPAADP
ncbi:MaoC family dehydratase [soil metagenome]